jgi:hypothetical protein
MNDLPSYYNDLISVNLQLQKPKLVFIINKGDVTHSDFEPRFTPRPIPTKFRANMPHILE